MKKNYLVIISVVLIFIMFSGCMSESESSTMSESEGSTMSESDKIKKYPAEEMPKEIVIKNLSYNVEYEIVLKEISKRELTNIEKEKSYKKDLGYIAIVKYSAKSKDKAYSNEFRLGDEFAVVLGENITYTHINKTILLDKIEYETEDYKDGYYQGYMIIEISKEAAEHEDTQLRYIEKGTTEAQYIDIK